VLPSPRETAASPAVSPLTKKQGALLKLGALAPLRDADSHDKD
jgi:hypothetical protein